ncbi:MAG: hypothetical protein ACREN5_07955, partial [Gemmatimonadales bacterium]
ERHLLLFAREVPAVGYRLYAVGYRLYSVEKAETAPGASPGFPLQARWNDLGVVTSILEEKSRREMLGPAGERPFGGLYVGSNRESFRLQSAAVAEARVTEGPVTRRVKLARPGSALPLSIVTLYREASYADLRFDVDLGVLQDDAGRELRYALAFPLRNDRQVFVDGAGFVLRAPQELLPGGQASHYMPVHFAHFEQGNGWGVTLANRDSFALRPDLLFLVAYAGGTAQTREEGRQRLFRTEPRSAPVQSFHFRIGIHGDRRWEWKRFGAELNLPLRAAVVHGEQVPPARGFFELSDPAVQLLAFKPAENRPGWHVLRLLEIAGTGAKGVKLSSPFRIAEALAATTVEEPAGPRFELGSFSLRPWETLT